MIDNKEEPANEDIKEIDSDSGLNESDVDVVDDYVGPRRVSKRKSKQWVDDNFVYLDSDDEMDGYDADDSEQPVKRQKLHVNSEIWV